MRFIAIILGLTFLISTALIFGPSLLGKSNSGEGGKIVIDPLEYDAGDISIGGGLLRKTYEIQNAGSGPLKIKNIETSCACTKAVLRVGDKTSPEFSMPGHGQNPVVWSTTLAPGQKGELEVIFDPAFHGPDALGPIVRVVYISTDDPQNKEVQVKLSTNVTR